MAVDSINIWVRKGDAGEAQVQLFAPDLSRVISSSSCTMDPARDYSCVLHIDGLLESTNYFYSLSVANWSNMARLHTLHRNEASLVFGSCNHQSGVTHGVFSAISDSKPDLFLSLGDFIYADLTQDVLPTEDVEYPGLSSDSFDMKAIHNHLLQKHRTAFSSPYIHPMLSSVPMVGIWDDHELINDFDSSRLELLAPAFDAFSSYMGSLGPNAESRLRQGQLYFNMSVGPMDLFVLDSRSFRGPLSEAQSPGKVHFGAEQEAALETFIQGSTAPFLVIASSVMWNDCGEFALNNKREPLLDAHWRYRDARARIFAALDKLPQHKQILLLSGDAHWPTVAKITLLSGRVIHEVSVSPLDGFALPYPERTVCESDGVASELIFLPEEASWPKKWPRKQKHVQVVSYYGQILADKMSNRLTVRIVSVENSVKQIVWQNVFGETFQSQDNIVIL